MKSIKNVMPVLGLVVAFFAVSMLASCGSEPKTEEVVEEVIEEPVVEEVTVDSTAATTDSTAAPVAEEAAK
jgi:hypothetical protein